MDITKPKPLHRSQRERCRGLDLVFNDAKVLSNLTSWAALPNHLTLNPSPVLGRDFELLWLSFSHGEKELGGGFAQLREETGCEVALSLYSLMKKSALNNLR